MPVMPAGGREAGARTAKRTRVIGAARRISSPADAWELRPREREESGKPRAFQAAQFLNPHNAYENCKISSWPFFDGLAPLEKRLVESEQARKIETNPSGRVDDPLPLQRRIPRPGRAAASSRVAAAAFPPEPAKESGSARPGITGLRLLSDRPRLEYRETGAVADIHADHGRRHAGDESAQAGLHRAAAVPIEARQKEERFRGDSSGHATRTHPRAGAGGAITLDIGFPYMERKPLHVGASGAGVSALRDGMDSEERA